jgi:hypothetical protein
MIQFFQCRSVQALIGVDWLSIWLVHHEVLGRKLRPLSPNA